MMRFLAVCSATRFWTRFTFSEESSNNSEKKSENFFSDTIPQTIKKFQKVRWDALFVTLHRFLQAEWRNTFFHFFIKVESKYSHFFGFYSNSNGE